MKTIDIKSGDSIAQFTTKSVTVEGKEYFYSNMSEVTHLPEKQVYCFSYEGQFHALPYEAKDSKVLGAIFGQVQSMSIQAQQNAAQPQQNGQAGQPKQTEQNSQTANTQTPQTVENSAASTETADASEKGSNDAVDAVKSGEADSKVNKSEAKADKTATKADKARDKAEKKAAKKAAKEKKKSEKPAKSEKPEKKEKTPMDAEKKDKLKRSLIIFGLIVIIIAAIAVIYGAIFGTSSAPSPLNPNSNESQQYDEIDQLINDLQ